MPRFQRTVVTEPAGFVHPRAIGTALMHRPRALIVPILVVFALAVICLANAVPRYTAQTRILLQARDTLDEATMAREVRRIRSPDLARRAVAALHLAGNDEFDPLAAGVSAWSRILIVSGLGADPASDTAQSRLTRGFAAKLDVFSLPETHLVTVRFTSRDRDLAARGADMVADLYIERDAVTRRSVATSADAAGADPAGVDQSGPDARVIERAAPPKESSAPETTPLLVVVTLVTLLVAAGYVAFGDIIARRASAPLVPERFASAPPPPPERPSIRHVLHHLKRGDAVPDNLVLPPVPAPPMPLQAGRLAAMVGYVAGFGRSAADSRDTATGRAAGQAAASPVAPATLAATYVGWDGPVAAPTGQNPAPAVVASPPSGTPPFVTPPAAEKRHAVVDRILADHVPGRGLHIVGTGIGAEGPSCAALVTLARGLAEKGRSIIVDLNATPARLAPLSDGGRVAMLTLDGLSELLAGEASFAEVIHRDHASRLNFIPAGRKEADFRDFDLILDALTETYDFIVLLTPTFPHSEIAKVMAPYADIMVLIAADEAETAMVTMLENELVAAGAREVLVTGTHPAATPDKVVA